MSTHIGAGRDVKAVARHGRVAGSRRARATGMLMATPAMLGIICFIAVPFFVAVGLSLYHVQFGSPRPPTYVGLRQFTRLFTNPLYSHPFYRALVNNFTFAAVVVPVQTSLALYLAILLNRKLRGSAIFRTIFFMPVVFPMALVAVIWRVIFDPSGRGLLNSLLSVLSFGHIDAHDWLGSSGTAMAAVIVLSIWQGAGFQMVILLAGLQEIPFERYEAAQLDGAGEWAQFRYVTLPGLRNTVIFVVTLTTILSLQLFDQVYILIQGAGLNQDATRTVLYEATVQIFNNNSVGQAAAITVVFMVIVIAITLLQRRLFRQEGDR